jgi:uncharacterized protein YjbI with pentapeptide repeats
MTYNNIITAERLSDIIAKYKDIYSSSNENDNLEDIFQEYGLNIDDLNFSNLDLKEANLERTTIESLDFSKSKLNNAKLNNIYIENCNLFAVDLSQAELRNANLIRSNLQKSNLSKADLTNAKFEECNLFAADLTNANIKNTSFKNTILIGAKFGNQQLSEKQKIEGIFTAKHLEAAIKRNDFSKIELAILEKQMFDYLLSNNDNEFTKEIKDSLLVTARRVHKESKLKIDEPPSPSIDFPADGMVAKLVASGYKPKKLDDIIKQAKSKDKDGVEKKSKGCTIL